MALTLNGSTGISGIAGSAGTPALQGNNDANTGYFFATDTLGLSTAGTERLRITSDGKICINNDNALSDLHICTAGSNELDGTLRIGGSSSNLGLVIDYDQDGATLGRITSNPTYNHTSALLKICVDGDTNPNQLVLTGAGRIGIGIADNTGAELQVVGTSSSGLVRIGGNNTSGVGLDINYSNSSATSTTFKQNYRATNAAALIKFDSGYFTFHTGTAGGESLRLENGKLGLNVSNPDSDLHVRTANSNNGTLRVGGSNSDLGITLTYDQGGSTTAKIHGNPVYGNSASLFHIACDGNDHPNQLVLKGDGNVGIGTISPTQKLEVNGLIKITGTGGQGVNIENSGGTNAACINLKNTLTNYVREYRVAVAGSDGAYATASSLFIRDQTANATRLELNTSGDVKVSSGDITFGTAGKGIVLGATSNLDSNTLDDYEEGLYTPTITTTGGSISVNTSYDKLSYIKIGRLVTVTGQIVCSVNSPTGNADLSLPFTSADLTELSGRSFSVNLAYLNGGSVPDGTGDYSISARISENDTTARLQGIKPNYDGSIADWFGAGSDLWLHFSYLAA